MILSASSTVKKLSIAAFGAVAAIGVFANASNAVTLVLYNFDTGGTANPPENGLNPTAFDPSVSATSFGATANLGRAGTTNTYYVPGNPSSGLAISYRNWRPGSSYDPNIYHTFTLTPTVSMDLTNITFDARALEPISPRSIEVRSSLNNFGSAIATSSLTAGGPWTAITGTLGDINITSPVEFRIYGYNALSPAGRLGVDNVVVNGTPVPEPSAMIGWGVFLT